MCDRVILVAVGQLSCDVLVVCRVMYIILRFHNQRVNFAHLNFKE